MIFNDDKKELLSTANAMPVRGREDVPATFGEAFTASIDMMFSEGQSNSRFRHYEPRWEQNAKALTELGYDGEKAMAAYSSVPDSAKTRMDEMIDAGLLTLEGDEVKVDKKALNFAFFPHYLDYAKTRMLTDRLAALHPGKLLTNREINEQVKDTTRRLRESNLSELQRADTFGGQAGAFTGTMVGALTDPVVLATLPIGGEVLGAARGASVTARALNIATKEAAVVSAIEVPIQASVFQFKQHVDSPYSMKEAAFNVLMAGFGAGALRGVASGIAGGVSKRRGAEAAEAVERITPEKAEQVASAYKQAVEAGTIRRAPEMDRAARELESYARLARENPLSDEAVHFEAVRAAELAVDAGERVDVSGVTEGAEPSVKPERRRNQFLRAYISKLDPEEVQRLLFTSDKTGLPNARAMSRVFEESPPPYRANIDADSLKFVNDTFGHQFGDQMLAQIGKVFREAGVDAFHVSGDEFVAIGQSQKQLEKSLKKAEKLLRKERITGPQGEIEPSFSFGVGKTEAEAERLMMAAKEKRRATGAAAGRGEAPPSFRPGRESQEGARDTTIKQSEINKEVGDEIVTGDMAELARVLERNPDIEVPEGIRIEGGEEVVDTVPARKVMDDLDKEADNLSAIEKCAFPE